MPNKRTEAIIALLDSFLHHPRLTARILYTLSFIRRGVGYGRGWKSADGEQTRPSCFGNQRASGSSNSLRSYFDSHTGGRGIWKWTHYFEIYHRHFGKFIGREVHVLEIGVYSGGSLQMWREYFGPKCRVYGVDIQEACKVYENDWTKIVVGDQGDRGFWKHFKEEHPTIDILIDDGCHETEQQVATLEEMLPHLRPGGVYLCEDLHGEHNRFISYLHGLATNLNFAVSKTSEEQGEIACSPTQFQTAIESIHLYPFVAVIEKPVDPVNEFAAPKRGTEWQPFL
jgi:23S rRNA U2552 (ribose-2'-O)-methylase RlmE/FtsJ